MKTLIACGVITLAHDALAQTFQGLGVLQGSSSSISADISGDGTTVVGRTAQIGLRSWRWTPATGITQIPVFPGAVYSEASAVSDNGSVVAGDGGTFPVVNGYRYNTVSGVNDTIDIPTVHGISPDGQVVLGNTTDSDTQARRWSQAGGTQGFGTLTGTPLGAGFAASANAANFDGSLITGSARVLVANNPFPGVYAFTPFVWDTAGGARVLRQNDDSFVEGTAHDMSPDGQVIVGFANNPAGSVFRWTQATGYQFIQPLILPGSSGTPRTSADGNAIIAGLNYWSPGTGVITIQQLLTQSGCNFTGWTITGAVGISDDGRTIAGNGTSPTGQTQAWIATVPTPGAGTLGVVTLAHAARRRRR